MVVALQESRPGLSEVSNLFSFIVVIIICPSLPCMGRFHIFIVKYYVICKKIELSLVVPSIPRLDSKVCLSCHLEGDNEDWVENIVGKGEKAGYQHFLLFLQVFKRLLS